MPFASDDPSGGDGTSDTSASEEDAFDRDLSGNIPTSDPDTGTSQSTSDFSFDDSTAGSDGGAAPAPTSSPSSGSTSGQSGGGGAVPQSVTDAIQQQSNQGARGKPASNQTDFAGSAAPQRRDQQSAGYGGGGRARSPTVSNAQPVDASPPGVGSPAAGPGRGGPARDPTQRDDFRPVPTNTVGNDGGESPPSGDELDDMMAQRGQGEPAASGDTSTADQEFAQGVETQDGMVGQQARDFEQQILNQYGGLSADEISISREGDQLTADIEESAERRIMFNALMSPGTRQQAAAVDQQLDAEFAGMFAERDTARAGAGEAVQDLLNREFAGDFAEFEPRGRAGVGGQYPGRIVETELDAQSATRDYDVQNRPGGGYNIRRTDRFDRDFSTLNDRAEEFLGVDVPFGGNPAVDEVEQFYDETIAEEGGEFVSKYTSPLIERTEATSESDPVTPAIPLAYGFGYRPLGTDPEFANLVSGPLKEIRGLPQVPSMVLEAAEGAAYLGQPAGNAAVDSVSSFYTGDVDRAMQRGRTAGRVLSRRGDFAARVGEEVGERALENIEENPLEFTGSVGAGYLIGAGASSAIRRGVTSGANVDAPSLSSVRSRTPSLTDGTGRINIVDDPDRGLFDIDPVAGAQIRDRLTPSTDTPGLGSPLITDLLNKRAPLIQGRTDLGRPLSTDLDVKSPEEIVTDALSTPDSVDLGRPISNDIDGEAPSVRAVNRVNQAIDAGQSNVDMGRPLITDLANKRGPVARGRTDLGRPLSIDLGIESPSVRALELLPDIGETDTPGLGRPLITGMRRRGQFSTENPGLGRPLSTDLGVPALSEQFASQLPDFDGGTTPTLGRPLITEMRRRGQLSTENPGLGRPLSTDLGVPAISERLSGLTIEVRPSRPGLVDDLTIDDADLRQYDIDEFDLGPATQTGRRGDADGDRTPGDVNENAGDAGDGLLQITQQEVRSGRADADTGVGREFDLQRNTGVDLDGALGAGLGAGLGADAGMDDTDTGFLYEDVQNGGIQDDVVGPDDDLGLGEGVGVGMGFELPGQGAGVGATTGVEAGVTEFEDTRQRLDYGGTMIELEQEYNRTPSRPGFPGLPFPSDKDDEEFFGPRVESNSETFSSGIQDVTSENIDDLLDPSGGTSSGGSDSLDDQFLS